MMQRDKMGTPEGHPICVCRFCPSPGHLPQVSDGRAWGAGSSAIVPVPPPCEAEFIQNTRCGRWGRPVFPCPL